MSKPWVGLIRVSHMGERRAGGANVHTDRDQVDAIEGEAKRMGVRLKLLEPELDVKGSWSLERRPALREAVEGIEQGRYAGLIVAYLTRLGRNTRQQLAAWERVEEAGGRIIVVRERIDTSTPSGRMFRTILLANGQRELEEHSERFENLREWATSAGVWQRRQTPRGYDRDPATRKLIPNDQAGEVRRAFHARAAGASHVSLSRELGMSPSGVRALLRNRVYLGELRVGEHVNAEAHPPLVTVDEFEAVQATRASRPPRSTQPPALLAGLARCAGCGHVMSRGRVRTARLDYWNYGCHRNHSAGTCTGSASVALDRLDAHVEQIALQELAKLSTEASRGTDDTRGARERLAVAERELAAYLAGVEAAGLDADQWASGAKQRRLAIDEAMADLERARERGRAVIDGDPVAAWARWDAARRNHVLRGLLECVIVRPSGRGRIVPVGDRVRVITHGAGLVQPYAGGGRAVPVEPMLWPDADSPVVLRMVGDENLADSASG